MKRYIKSAYDDIGDGVILYRIGNTEPSIISTSPMGVFFANKPDYFYNHPKMNFTGDFKRYMLAPNALVWDPAKDFTVFDNDGYDKIYCLLSDLDKFGLEDECDWEVAEGYGITSTDGLAYAGKRLGYDALVIRHIWYQHGYFDEYVVYNPDVIKPI